ncbi:MAG: DUF4382 domain-containing protein [Phycisphaerae bacterium]
MDSRHRQLVVGLLVCLVIVAGVVVLLVNGLLGRRGSAGTPDLPAGRLKVVMGRTSAPAEPLKRASLTVSRVEVLRQRTAPQLAENAGFLGLPQAAAAAGADQSWVVVQEGEQIINLLEIEAGQANLLINADLPEGRYTSLRLTCREGRVTLGRPRHETPDETFVLDANRGKAGEVTLDCEFTIAPGRETALLLDVDVNEAFQPIKLLNGQEDILKGFQFNPRTAMRLINLLSAGTTGTTAQLLSEHKRRPDYSW